MTSSHDVGSGSWSSLPASLSHDTGAGRCHHQMMTGLRVAAVINAQAGVIAIVGGVVNNSGDVVVPTVIVAMEVRVMNVGVR